MGDRCFMSVTCRWEDRKQFEDLGFVLAYGENENSSVIEMIDEEANYAHYQKMPSNIPYYGNWAAGSDYGPGNLVCDGVDYVEVPATSDGFVVPWNYRWGLPKLKPILKIRRFLRLERKVKKRFHQLRESEPKHLFSPHTDCCVKCGISAEDDAMENSPCKN